MKKWRPQNTERVRRSRLLQRYGLTPEDFDAMYKAQGGVCAICEKPETAKHRSGATRHLCVDHCHATGRVRGLLCHSCNRVLGLLRDDRERLRRALAYLED